MPTRVTGQAAALTVAPTPDRLAAHRTAIEALLATSDVITDLEFQTAAQRVNACESVETLQKWYRNCVREIARREEEAPAQAVVEYLTAAQREEITRLAGHPLLTRPERTRALLQFHRLSAATAVALIGDLYQKVLDRGGIAPVSGEVVPGARVLAA